MSHNPPSESIAAAVARLKSAGNQTPMFKRPSGPIRFAQQPPAKSPSQRRQSR